MEELLRKTTNVLLAREDLGKSKPAPYRLPGPDFAYGKSAGKDQEGAREVVNSWQYHAPSQEGDKKVDFRSLNKISVRTGLSTAKDFRRVHKINNDITLNENQGQRAVKLTLPEEEFRFGAPNRPSTPMDLVMGHKYGQAAAEFTEDLYKSRLEESYRKPSALPRLTKSAKLNSDFAHKKLEKLETQKPLFKMKKFQGLTHKVDNINHRYIQEKSEAGTARATEPKTKN